MNKLMTEEQVKTYLAEKEIDISVSMLRRMRWKGYEGKTPRIPYHKIAGKVRYRKAELDDWAKRV